MNRKIILLVLLFCSLFGISQTTTETYNTPYQTTGQNLWQEGTGGLLEINHVFFDQNWSNSTSFGPIYSVAGSQFGANISAGTWGSIGAGFQLNFGTEQVDIDYNADMRIVRPTDLSFDPGDEIVLKTNFSPRTPPQSNVVTDVYDANMRLWLKFGMGINLSANVCVFSCSNHNIINLNMPVDTFDMISAGNLTGISLLDGLYEWPASDAFPFSYTDPRDIITVDITLPSNAGANIYFQGNDLHSFVNPSQPYFNTYFSIPKFIGALHIPYVSAFFANLSNSWTAGPFYLNYTLMEAGFNLGLYHKQHLTLRPTMKGKFDLPTKLDYEIFNPTTGTIYSQGYDSIINYTVGNSIRLQYPCNYDFIDVTPSFNMENTFTNHTYDSIALDFVFQMLEFDMGMNSITVIPQICIPIYYPCPTWSNPLKMCKKTVCTPPVVFGGFHTGFGPLIDWQPNLFNIKYDWCNNTWSMGGFNSFDSMTPFRLEPRKFSIELNVTPVLCHGESTGVATATVTNGNPPYTYEWSNGNVITSNSTTNTQTGLAAGTHYVIVRDAKECSVFDSKVIVEPELPLSINYEINNPSCHDSYDGSINITVSGGTPNYSYLWSNSETSSSISGLDAGNYALTVTDFNGCTLIETFTLVKPEPLSATISTQDVLCKGDNSGFAIIETTGGTPEYSFNWSNGNSTASDMSLIAGTYTITISDNNLCQVIETIIITEPDEAISFNNEITNVSCYGDSTGSINTITSGGTQPYTYQWFNADFIVLNETSNQISNIPAGDYRLIVKDDNNCADSADLTITQPDSLSYEFTVVDVLCKGAPQGEILVSLSGATPPYTYHWSTGTTTTEISGLLAGEYYITVTDINSCEFVLSTVVNEPLEDLSATTNAIDVLCKGDSTGVISATTTGGTFPYTYLWSNNETTSEISNIPAATYTLTVTDANGCLFYSGAVVSEPENSLSVTSVPSPVSCFGYSDGSLLITLNGGTLPYTITWDDNSYILSTNQQSINDLQAGIFNILVSDGNNCFVKKSYNITSPDSVLIETSPSTVSCFNGNDGIVHVDITGGTPPYSFLWSNGSSNQDLENVSSGTYDLSITDSNNCIYTTFTEVTEMTEIIVSSIINPVSCKDINDASIKLNITGGTGNYYFAWSNETTNQDAENLSPGLYSVTVSDDNQCEIYLDFTIEQSFIECLRIPSSFSPNNDGINDVWVISSIDEYPNSSVQIFNKWGNILYDNQGMYIPWDGKFNGKPLPADVYYYIIDLNNGDEPYTGTITILR
ncbi:MAG: T9SS type B sorting domain-containing protein [Clostridia bacterium]|nr:T9SS type B sorting domain-containing protein [Clostridia bacterium]